MPDNHLILFKKDAASKKRSLRHFSVYEIVLMVLVLLSVIGMGITDFSPDSSHWYWFAMVPIFGVACVVIEWSRSREKGYKRLAYIRTQLFHWIGLLVAVQLVYVLLHSGRLNSENAGLVLILLLSLTTYLAGIHLGWHFCLLGVLLAIALAMAAYLEALIWLMLFAVIVAGIIVFSIMKYKTR